MFFTIDTRDLQDGVTAVARALAPKPMTSSLEGIHAVSDGNTLTMTGSDGQLTIHWTGEASVAEQGDIILPGKILAELVRKLPSATVAIKTDSTSVSIVSGKSRSRMSTISGTYPDEHQPTDPAVTTTTASVLRDLITHCQSCISTLETRPILTGALLTASDETGLTMVALDGFRLALKTIHQQTGATPARAVIPRKALQELARILPSDDSIVTISIGGGIARFTCDNIQLSTTLLSGEYVDYQKLLPTSYATSIRTDRTQLQDAIDRAGLMAKAAGQNGLIRFDISGDILSISSQAEAGSVSEQVDILHQGNDIKIAFNVSYISDAIRSAPGDTVTLNFNTPSTPVTITPEEGHDWMYLVLPVRIF